MKKEELIKLAFAAAPHGIKGEVELRLFNPDPENSILENGMMVWLFPSHPKSKIPSSGQEWKIEKIRFGNKVICQFEGIKDRTHLETLLPFEIYLAREFFPEAQEDEIYLVDLIDMDVINQSGEVIGKLESFSDNGMQYLLDIRLQTGQMITLPYVTAFFPDIDLESKKITMIMPEYTE